MHLKISKNKLTCSCVLLLLYNINFIRFPYLAYANLIRYSCILMLGVLIFLSDRFAFTRVKKKYLVLIVLYCVLILISGYINRNEHNITHTFISALVYCVTIFETLGAFCYVIKKKDIHFIIKTLLHISLFYILMNDIFLLLSPEMFFTTNGAFYLVGNKFAVAYRHMETIGLFIADRFYHERIYKEKFKNVIILISLIILSFITFFHVKGGSGNSITGVVCVVLLLALNFVPFQVLLNRFVFLFAFVGAGLFPVFFDLLLSIPIIQNFIINTLHRDLTLTGRVVIYRYIPEVLKNHLMLGYGHGSSYEVWMKFTHVYPNSQNGLIDCIVEQGVIATIILVIIVTLIVRSTSKIIKTSSELIPIIHVIYVYAIIASVEVTISITFVTWCLLLLCTSMNNINCIQRKQDIL